MGGCTASKTARRSSTGASHQQRAFRSDIKAKQATVRNFGENLVRLNKSKLTDIYDVDNKTVLGKGACGSVCVVRKRTKDPEEGGEVFAMKTVRLDGMSGTRMEDLRVEIEVQSSLDHPNIVRVYEYFEEGDCMHIIMELCTGGSLVSRISRMKKYDEADAATLVHKMLSAVLYIHQHGVIHRDIKLDNFIYTNNSPEAELKMIDFGFAYEVEDGRESMFEQIGTPSYMAPELWSDYETEYNSSVDMWAIGVVTFMLLSGRRPFHSSDPREKARIIREEPVKFDGHDWAHISHDAKDFIKKLLSKSPSKRASASQALKLPWIKKHSFLLSEAPSVSMSKHIDVVSALMDFSAASDMRKLALEVLAFAIPPSKVEELKKLFVQLDTDNTGTLCKSEFREALKGVDITDDAVEQLFERIDVNSSGELEYSEFISASLNPSFMHAPSIRSAFSIIDRNQDGTISVQELRNILGDEYSEAELATMLKERGAPDSITYDDFQSILLADMSNTGRADGIIASLSNNLKTKLGGKKSNKGLFS